MPDLLQVVPWQSQHLKGCIEVFKSNLPEYFAEHELAEFIEFLHDLSQAPEDLKYWVVTAGEEKPVVVACGGTWINRKKKINQGNPAYLIWGMVDKAMHRKGIGSVLLNARIEALTGTASVIQLDTTPLSFPFYQKSGFVQTDFEKDGYEPGLDKIFAELALPGNG